MDAADAIAQRFLLAYYSWARSCWKTELEGGFPLLGMLGRVAGAAQTALETLVTLPPEERVLVADALLKRSHSEGMELAGESLSVAENELLDRWLDLCRKIEARREIGPAPSRPDRSALRRAVRRELQALLAGQALNRDGSNLFFVRTVGNWSIDTNLDLGGRTFDLAYDHSVFHDGRLIKTRISALAWLGISVTTFDGVGRGEEEAAARLACGLVGRFLDSAPVLFDSL